MNHRANYVTLGLCLALSSVVFAETDGPAIQTLVVTAQNRAQAPDEVSMSLNTASADELAAAGATSPRDLQALVPDLHYTVSPYGAPIYSLRGIGYFDEALAAAPTVTVYVDQAPSPFSRMREGTMLDIERVEIMKGTQGTVFGQNSTGGGKRAPRGATHSGRGASPMPGYCWVTSPAIRSLSK